MEGVLHLPHQLWGAAWGPASREAPPSPFPSNFTKLPGSPGGVPSSKGLARGPGRLALGDGAGGADASTHTRHLFAAPGDTKSCFAAPPCSPRAGGHPHPAPARPKEAKASAGHSSGTPARPRPARPRLPSAAARLPGVPFGAGDSTRAQPWRPEPSPLHSAARPQAKDRGAPARFLPSSGSRAQAALIPALKLNTGAARRPPRRRREATAATGKQARRPEPRDAAAPSAR